MMASSGNRSVIVIRVVYNGVEPTYCDENCVRQNLWAGDHNVDGLYAAASWGAVRFPESAGAVITVAVTGELDVADSCRYWAIAEEADRAARNQYNIDPNRYAHQVYYLPREISSCTFGGLGFYGCPEGQCKVWLRQQFGTNLAHELGHNLDLRHSTTDNNDDGVVDNEYGDNSCVMAASATWRSINGGHRLIAGWIPESGIRRLTTADLIPALPHFDLAALHVEPGQSSIPSVVVLPRALGGWYIVSFRSGGHYDIEMGTRWRHRVAIHSIDSLAPVNTRLISATSVGQIVNFGGFSLVVTEVWLNSARIHIALTESSDLTVNREESSSFLGEQKSNRNCTQLGWPVSGNGSSCGASELGGVCYYNLPAWGAAAVCQRHGARLCTELEISDNVARGTGCGLDNSLIWTKTACLDGAITMLGQRPRTQAHAANFPTRCQLLNYSEASVRCCADTTARGSKDGFALVSAEQPGALPARLNVDGTDVYIPLASRPHNVPTEVPATNVSVIVQQNQASTGAVSHAASGESSQTNTLIYVIVGVTIALTTVTSFMLYSRDRRRQKRRSLTSVVASFLPPSPATPSDLKSPCAISSPIYVSPQNMVHTALYDLIDSPQIDFGLFQPVEESTSELTFESRAPSRISVV